MESNILDGEKYYTVEQVALILQVHWQTILQYIKSGELKAFKLGRAYRVPATELEKFIDKRMTERKK